MHFGITIYKRISVVKRPQGLAIEGKLLPEERDPHCRRLVKRKQQLVAEWHIASKAQQFVVVF